MERPIILRRPWTCRWSRFGEAAASGETASFVFWSCIHPALPDGPKLLDLDMCTECPRWTASSQLTAETGDRLKADGGDKSGGPWTPSSSTA